MYNKKRETGFEPATLALARRYSTTEPLAHKNMILSLSLDDRTILSYLFFKIKGYLYIFILPQGDCLKFVVVPNIVLLCVLKRCAVVQIPDLFNGQNRVCACKL